MKIKTPKSLAELENNVAIASKKKRIETAILGLVSLTAFAGAVALAPNAVQVLQHIVPDTRPLSHKQSVRRAIGRLIKNKYIEKTGSRYRLTKEGEKYLNDLLVTAVVQTNRSAKNQRWDGKWRVVTFDIKESRRNIRDELRSFLVQSGFVKLQDSIWVYPFRCDEIISLLKFKLTLGWDMVYMIVDAIEGDEWLLKHYGLKRKK